MVGGWGATPDAGWNRRRASELRPGGCGYFSEFAGLLRLSRVVLAGRRIPDLVSALPKTEKALAYAERIHAGQLRQVDGAPFILHPIEVASLLYYAGAADHVIAAGALHDTIEKTDARAADLRKRFGQRITRLVLAVTEDQRITDYHERKAALREQAAGAGQEALMVFTADKISKVRELRLEAASGHRQRPTIGSRSLDQRLIHYHECLELLERRLLDASLLSQLRTEVGRLPRALSREPVPAV